MILHEYRLEFILFRKLAKFGLVFYLLTCEYRISFGARVQKSAPDTYSWTETVCAKIGYSFGTKATQIGNFIYIAPC